MGPRLSIEAHDVSGTGSGKSLTSETMTTRPGLLPAPSQFDSWKNLPAPAFAAAAFTVPVIPAASAATWATPAAFEAAAEAAATAVTTSATAIAIAAATTTATEAALATTAAESASARASATEATATTAEPAATARQGAWLGLEAVTAIHRAITAGFKGNFCFFSARCAGCIEQLPWGTAPCAETADVAILLLLQPATVGTTPRLPCETF